ncbi:aldo/keto reductase [Chloroflexota bacterium]
MMELVRLGMTGLMVSRIGLGGIPMQRLGEAEAIALVRRCLDLGINFIDTANSYTTSEGFIGKAVTGRPRNELVLATKSTSRTTQGLKRHLALSLERLGVEKIDLYQFHAVDDFDTLRGVIGGGDAMAVVREARDEGKIGHIGITSHSPEVAKEAAASGCFETLMFPFNLVSPEAAAEIIPLCRQHDVGFIAMKPMGGGALENASIAMKFLLQFPVVVPVVGMEQLSHAEELARIAAADLGLTADEKREIERTAAEIETTYCRQCDYCQPCLESIPIAHVLLFQRYLRCFPPNLVFQGWVAQAMEKAEDCTECGECEGRCPFRLPIREMFKENIALFRRLKDSAS